MDIAQLGFQIDSRGAVTASRNLDGMSAAAGRAQTASERMAAKVQADLNGINSTLRSFAGGFAAAFSIAALTQFARGIGRVADEYANLQGKLRLITSDTEQLGAVTQQVFAISQRTFASMDATATLVARTTRALVSNGAAQDEALSKSLLLSEAVNNAFLVSGATTQEASNAIIQLSQGLAAGALRGEEFNSIAEQGPRIMQALAQYLGVTTGQLRAMAQEGKLTAEIVQNALLASFDQLTEEAAQMPVTIGRAFSQLDNSFTMLVGSLDQAGQGSAGVAAAIQTVAQAIDMVTPSLTFLVQSWSRNKTATDDSANATRQLAEAMRTVVGGLIIAKNAVDVLVDGFVVMVRIGMQAAFALIEGFDDVVTTFSALVRGLQNPAALLGSAGEIEAAMGRMGERVKLVLEEGDRAGRDFQESLAGNISDVAAVFEMLNQELQGVPASAAPVVGAIAGIGVQAGASAAEVEKLARAQKMMLDLIGGLRGDESPEMAVQEDHAKNLRQIEEAQRRLIAAGEDEATVNRMVAEAIKLANAQRDRELRAVREVAAQKERARGATGRLLDDMETEISLLRMGFAERRSAVAAMQAEEAMRRAIAEAQQAGLQLTESETQALMDAARERGKAIEESERLAQLLDNVESPFQRMTADLALMRAELARVGEATSDAFDPERAAGLRAQIGATRQEMLVGMVGAAQQVLGSVQKLSKEGSKSYKAMEVASQALNVVLAIGAILNQGKGDPITAWGRMAAMAVAVAGLVGSIGANFGGSNGFTDTAEERQRTQGTGTVLGDAEAKSQSIANATQITADATTALVGINRGMLQALQALQGGLDRAGGMLARGAGQADFAGVPGAFNFGSAWMGGMFGSLADRVLDPLGILGGSQQVTDQGLAIGGGSLSDVGVNAYQEQQYRRWRFGSRRTREEMAPVGEEFASQFQLIVDSITETVRQGAIALGMVPAEVEAALEAFRLAEIRISLKDLSAEEQQAELLAVFSQIFDNLAGSVVPYIEQFQRVGEGLGETLVRVATAVQVTQEAVNRLGFGMGQLNPERFAQVAVALVDMVGGIEAFIQSMQSFVDKFAPEAHKFEVAHSDLTRAFTEAGLVLPTTRDGMWALMQSLDATTEAGQAQIATLLRLTNTADAYYTMLERRAPDAPAAQFDAEAALRYADAVADINRQLSNIDGTSDFVLSLREIAGQYNANVGRLNELGRAAGLAGAREEDLARALQLSTMQRMRAIQALEEEARALVRSLGLDALGQLDEEIAALQAVESQASAAVSSFGSAMGEAAQAASDAVNLLLGDLSPLRDAQKFEVAMEALRAGQVGPEDVLRIARRMFASGQDYRSVFDQVMKIGDRRDQGGGSVGGGGPVGSGVSPEMQALLDRRAELEAQANAAQRFGQAQQLAQMIADIAGADRISFEEAAARANLLDIDQLRAALGLDTIEGLNSYLTALQADSYTLEDIAATITAGEQLIVDTLRDIFEVQALVDRLAERSEAAMAESDQRIEGLEIPERIADSSEPVQEELRLLRQQVAELTAALQQVVTNTGVTAGATGVLAETVANQDLINISSAPRSTRQGRNAEFGETVQLL